MAKRNNDDKFDEHRTKFYALIGHCVTSYQSVEDYLPALFNAALSGDEERNSAIFSVAKGLEGKLNLISASLQSAEDSIKSRWSELLGRITRSAEARNQIAHAKPVHHGSPVTIIMSDDGSSTVRVNPGGDQMKLHKATKSGAESVWTADEMRERTHDNHKLFGHLIAFAMQLRGETPPDHLLEP